MSQYLSSLEWGEPVLGPSHDPDVAAQARRELGRFVPAVVSHAAAVPWIARTIVGAFRLDYSHLSRDELGLSMLVAVRETSCRYCYGSIRAMVGLLGWPADRVERLEAQLDLEDLDERQRAIVTFTRSLTRCAPFPGAAERGGLEAAGLDRAAIAELVYFVAIESFATRVASGLAVPPEAQIERMPASLMVKLLRPLLARLTWPQPQAPVAVTDEGSDALAPLVRALDGSPVAAKLRRTLDGAFGAGGMDAAERLGLIAAVSEALGGRAALALARAGAGSAGTLHEPDEAQARRLAFAVDSVSLRPMALQHRTRALVESIGASAALDVLGTAALGHLVARVGWLLQPPEEAAS